MTNNAHKKAARQRQAETGVPYSQALRDVDTRAPRTNLVAHLGTDADGATVTLDLNEPSRGGVGPHCFITGRTGSGKSTLVERIIRSLAGDERTAPQMFAHARLSGAAPPPGVTLVEKELLTATLAQLLDDRARTGDGDAPPVVVLIDNCDGWLQQPSMDILTTSSATLRRLAREGRALGIHLVVAMQHEYPEAALGGSPGSAVADNIPTGIRLNSPSFGELRFGEGLLQHSTHFDIHRYCKTSELDVRFRFEAP